MYPGERQRLTDEAALQHEKLMGRLADRLEMWGEPAQPILPTPKRPPMTSQEILTRQMAEWDAQDKLRRLEDEAWRKGVSVEEVARGEDRRAVAKLFNFTGRTNE